MSATTFGVLRKRGKVVFLTVASAVALLSLWTDTATVSAFRQNAVHSATFTV